MSSVGEREQGLVVDLILGRVSDDEFCRRFPIKPGQCSETGRNMLARALEKQDAVGVEFGLHLGHRFGISDAYLDLLLELAEAPWHQRHEDVINALAKLKSPDSVETLFRTALSSFSYREYDESNSLGRKCVHTLAAIRTRSALARLGDLLASGEPNVESAARRQLERIEREDPLEEVRTTARHMLASRGPGEGS